MFFELEGRHTLGRNESRGARLRDFKDFGKGHIILHYLPVFLGRKFKVVPVGAVGDDRFGAELKSQMANTGMDTFLVKTVKGIPTLFSACFLYPDGSGGNLTVTDSASSRLGPADIQRAEPFFKKFRGRGMALAAPEVPMAARLKLLQLATRYGFFRAVAVTSGELQEALRRGFFEKTDLVALNEDEAKMLAGGKKAERAVLKAVAKRLAGRNPGLKISVTWGSKGAYAYEKGKWEFTPAFKVRAVNTAGAGDSHLSALLIALASGMPFMRGGGPITKGRRTLMTAGDFAALLASAKVTSRDTIHLGLDRKVLKAHAGKLRVKVGGTARKLFA
jgi:sugar/nucleoside kinase (ribokinase family)